MSPKIAIVRKDGDMPIGDVIIDARGPPQFYDVIILSGKELRSLVAIASIDNGIPIGIGKYTKRPVAAVVGGKVIIRAIPLTLYEKHLEKEFLEIFKRDDNTFKKLKEIIITERRKYGHSQTLSLLHRYLSGEISTLPPYLADVVKDMSKESLRKLFDKIIEEVY